MNFLQYSLLLTLLELELRAWPKSVSSPELSAFSLPLRVVSLYRPKKLVL